VCKGAEGSTCKISCRMSATRTKDGSSSSFASMHASMRSSHVHTSGELGLNGASIGSECNAACDNAAATPHGDKR
jgi:hypothetical protein